MASLTGRMGLIKPNPVGEVIDVAQLNQNMDNIDDMANTSVVTSSTRPPAPFVGQMIYENDTGLVRLWNGSTWAYVSGRMLVSRNRVSGGGQNASSGNRVVISLSNQASGSENAGVFSTYHASNRCIEITEPGEYCIEGWVGFPNNSSGRRGLDLRESNTQDGIWNGTTVAGRMFARSEIPAVTSIATHVNVTATKFIDSTYRYIGLTCYQDSGVTLNIEGITVQNSGTTNIPGAPRLTITRVG